MKNKIIAKSKEHLISLIAEEIQLNGNQCDLNHIDISKVISLANLFDESEFNGDISEWNVSHIRNMSEMFKYSLFNGDISKWNVSNVVDMEKMFYQSQFNQDISKWDVSNVRDMDCIFYYAEFKGDISNWKPYNLKIDINKRAFIRAKCPIPYWADFSDNEKMVNAINNYWLKKELEKDLSNNKDINKKIKV